MAADTRRGPLGGAIRTCRELAGRLAADRRSLLGHTGLTCAVAPLVQLDVHVAIGLTGAAPDALLGVGVSARW